MVEDKFEEDFLKRFNDVTNDAPLTNEEVATLREIFDKNKVLAYATPKEKLTYVSLLMACGAVVTMAGESIADVQSLKQADVGITLDGGCDVAKDNADLVIVREANFDNIKTSLMWGRQLYANVQKFIVFQLTVNLVVTMTTLIGGCIGHVPFNVLQMLWINLIMDTLGAIALCTEPWTGQDIPRASRKDQLLPASLFKLIFVPALFQILVLVVLMFFYGMMAFEKAPNLFTDPLRDPLDKATDRLVMDTFIFHTFMIMTLFNQFNCRNIDCENLNPFSNLLGHLFFLLIWAAEVAIQQYMVMQGTHDITVPSALLGVGPLRWWEHMTAYILGLLTMGVFAGAKKVPDSAFKWCEKLGLENTKNDDAISNFYTRGTGAIQAGAAAAANPDAIRAPEDATVDTETDANAVAPLDEDPQEEA
jgi:magnesium-transporting ATPase (P-type)